MADYIIRIIRRGESPITEKHVMGLTKKEARQIAKRAAELSYPDARYKWSQDCRMAFDADGNHLGDVAVEQYQDSPVRTIPLGWHGPCPKCGKPLSTHRGFTIVYKPWGLSHIESPACPKDYRPGELEETMRIKKEIEHKIIFG